MASSTTNLDLTLPVGGENVSRQIINANNVKIDEAVGPVPSGTDLQSEVDALNNNIANIDPKRGNIASVANDTYLIGLNAGTYQIVVASASAVTNGYIPSQYGTLTVNDSGASYKSYVFVATNGKAFYRACHKNDQTWYTEWQELALKDDFVTDGFSFVDVRSSTNLQILTNDVSVAKTGYTPIMAQITSSWDETYWVHTTKLSSNTLTLKSLHIGTTDSKITITVRVLYKKD